MGRSGGVANVRGEVAFVAQQVLGDVDVEGDVDENDDRGGVADVFFFSPPKPFT